MKLMLTSFGVTEHPVIQGGQALFYRMPPINMRAITNTFMPDYAALLLCERLILDKMSFAILQDEPPYLYRSVADVIKILHEEGFIELVDFNYVLQNNQELLQKMHEHDLATLDQWIAPLKESLNTWASFTKRAARLIDEDQLLIQLLEEPPSSSWIRGIPPSRESLLRGRGDLLDSLSYSLHSVIGPQLHLSFAQYMEESKHTNLADNLFKVKETLSSYLAYINANLVLSNELGAGFHDWADFTPFYKQKFLTVGQDSTEAHRQIDASQNLFHVSFPELAVTSPTALLKILHDKRVEELRKLVHDAAEGKVTFDQEFAKRTLWEVLKLERQTSRYRNIISYVTLPLDFLPWVGALTQKAVEEGIGVLTERKLKKKYQWFYLLSDVAEAGQKKK